MFYVYQLQSLKHPNERYTGFTSNIEVRLAAHNSGPARDRLFLLDADYYGETALACTEPEFVIPASYRSIRWIRNRPETTRASTSLPMYTGIVTATFPIADLEKRTNASTFKIAFDAPHLEELAIGASVSIDGVCMSVAAIEDTLITFDASIETLRKTNLGDKRAGDLVNVERSAKTGVEIGGHPMSGHVDGTVPVVAIDRPENNCVLTFELPADYRRYVFNKGFIGLNGCSLTVTELDRVTGRFKVYLIPETLRQTTYQNSQVGDRVNFEIDRQTQVMVDTIHDAVRLALSDATLTNAILQRSSQ